MHHIAFEMKDFVHIQNACELLALRKMPINRGPVRHGPGHNVAIYHRNADDQLVEFYIELDQMKDEELGYFDPRPWPRHTPATKDLGPQDFATISGAPDYLCDLVEDSLSQSGPVFHGHALPLQKLDERDTLSRPYILR